MKSFSKYMLLEALGELGRCDVTVDGESMKPFIRCGDVATIATIPSYPRLGQVAVFFNDDQLIMHRITRRKKLPDGSWDLSMYGDSSPYSGGKVDSSQVIGVVRYLNRNSRRHVLWFSYPFCILAVPIGFFIRFLVHCKCVFKQKKLS
jgi:hypothetical protein